MIPPSLPRRAAAELIGTALLLAAVVGSGIMGERLAGTRERAADNSRRSRCDLRSAGRHLGRRRAQSVPAAAAATALFRWLAPALPVAEVVVPRKEEP